LVSAKRTLFPDVDDERDEHDDGEAERVDGGDSERCDDVCEELRLWPYPARRECAVAAPRL